MSETNSAEAIELLLKTGREMQPLTEIPGASEKAFLTPVGFTIQNAAQYFPPTRIKQRVGLTDAGSFADYVNRFKDQDTVIFARINNVTAEFIAWLDYHRAKVSAEQGNTPRYCSHLAQFVCIETQEWQTWMKHNRHEMEQVQFAEFLEENQDLIVTPTGAELLELVSNLEAKKNVRFNSAHRLASGKNAIDYDEDIQLRGAGTVTTASGSLEIPAVIAAGIAPFEGCDKYEVKARIKYRINARQIVFWYETIACHRIVRDAVQGMYKTIHEKTGILPFIGSVGT